MKKKAASAAKTKKQTIEEAEETLRAIREGAVDAFVVTDPDGHRVYTLEGSDLPYSVMVERMQQGAGSTLSRITSPTGNSTLETRNSKQPTAKTQRPQRR